MNLILLRGGGDLGSGIALRLHRAGFSLVIVELDKPLAVRRTVSFSEAVYDGMQTVEGVTARLVSADQIQVTREAGEIPILVDPNADILRNPKYDFRAVIDARLMKSQPQPLPVSVALHIGLGPGFRAGRDCDAVIETQRGHTLGRVYWEGEPLPDTGQPDNDPRRVLRAPCAGVLFAHVDIGDRVEEGQLIAEIEEQQSSIENRKSKIVSPFNGMLRGLIRPGVEVKRGMKIGDVDERGDASYCYLVSDKALAVGGGVLEALLMNFSAKT